MSAARDNGRRRVVVTGLGMVTPLGNTVDESWEALIAGESGAGKITQFDPEGFPVDFACEVKNLDVTDYVDYKASRRMDRFTHLALAAARQAETDSGIEIVSEPDRVGAAVATGIGGAYMMGSRCALVAPMPLSALVGTTSSLGTVLLRGAMPFTSLSWPTWMPCFLAIDSKLSPCLG